MAIYSIANRTSNTTTANACIELRTTSTNRATVYEIGIFLAAATASTFGLGRPGTNGITPSSPITGLAEDSGAPAGTAQTALAWVTGPVIPPNVFRRIGLPATVGTGVIWTFPRGLIVPVSSTIVIWNLAANGVADIYFVWDE